MKIETLFNLGDMVHAKPLDVCGEIQSITFGRDGMNYKVRYVSSGEFKYEWFYEEELESKEKQTIGFND